MQEEIEKVKKRRLDREKERAEQEEMLNILQRERGAAEAVELERKEEEFHLEQAKSRAKHRIRDGRYALVPCSLFAPGVQTKSFAAGQTACDAEEYSIRPVCEVLSDICASAILVHDYSEQQHCCVFKVLPNGCQFLCFPRLTCSSSNDFGHC